MELDQVYANDRESASNFNIVCVHRTVCCCRPEVTLGVQEITEKKSKLGVSAGVIS